MHRQGIARCEPCLETILGDDTVTFPIAEISRPRIAIAGATGRVGAALVRALTEDPVHIVALTRTPKAGAVPDGVILAKVDFDVPATLAEALHGADRLFLAHGTSDRQVADENLMIDAAVAAGVSHIVKLSAMGPPTRLHPFDWHMVIEAHLATKPVGYTVLRPGPFADVLARSGGFVANGNWGGSAALGRINLIDTRDIADVARVLLLDDRFADAQRAYHLTGPGATTMPDVAERLSQMLGRNIVYQHRTPTEHRAVLIDAGASEMVADLALGLDRLFRDSVLAETTETVSELTGKQPRSVADWLSDNLSLFQSASGEH
ncbi:NmrA family NAD(P)-binding protein [Sphingomonas sp. MMS12-HWE2-04]|uniref:NmrA family NAD(P)-binding protein n=1 Tax=Sphingomonas sp. MMS12-HWE2-04 TaxID=3234199 RepID=UPI00385040AE